MLSFSLLRTLSGSSTRNSAYYSTGPKMSYMTVFSSKGRQEMKYFFYMTIYPVKNRRAVSMGKGEREIWENNSLSLPH